MAKNEPLYVELVERELVNVNIAEKELIKVNLNVIDIIERTSADALTDFAVYNETPTKLTAKRFQTDNNFMTGTLRVFLNGIKEKNITIINDNKFELPIDSITSDTVEVNYIKG